ncbi:Glycoside hydrolase [Rhizoctonia solani]|uniref:lytic cellulose monooxygenase (C4-dehydrogenating) n=1 Tax=Rhizoctonia solani TaxID=456999 RepID=A0A8H7I6E1_9AGAM|nr:Glycoside hydrolase [Rhizoctonia solani]
MLALPALLLAAATSVLGHGFVQEIVASSGTYTGYLPYNDPYTTPLPKKYSLGNGPIEDVTSMDIQCNGGAVPAPAIIKVAAGSNVALNWTTWPDSHIGPLITYMARAPSDITKWSPGTSSMSRVFQNGKWLPDILTENKSIYTFKVPASLKAGQYLIRHEIIALHSGTILSSSNVQSMTLLSSLHPRSFQLVAFPGAYKSTDPGILFDPYKGATSYTIPGQHWTGGSSSGNAPTSVTTVPTTAPAATTTARPTTQAPASMYPISPH